MQKRLKMRLKEISTNKIDCPVDLKFNSSENGFMQDLEYLYAELNEYKDFTLLKVFIDHNINSIGAMVQWREVGCRIEIR